MRIINDKIFDEEIVTNETKVSEAFEVEHIYGFSIQLVYSGAGISGSFKLQASNDGENWDDVTNSEQVISGPDSFTTNVDAFHSKYFRVSVTSDNANPMTMNGRHNQKGV